MVTHAIFSDADERIAREIVDCAYSVHIKIGPGLLEHIYETCFCHELTKRGLSIKRQASFPIIYDGIIFDDAIRIDVFVEDKIICELKSVEAILPVHKAQLLSYLKLTGNRLGFLINFNVAKIKDGISRFVI